MVQGSGGPYVRVLHHNDFERQRQMHPNRSRIHLNNDYINEEIVYTSPAQESSQRTPTTLKRNINEPSPVGTKAQKLEAAES